MATNPHKASRLADHPRQAEEDCTFLLGVSAGQEEALTELYDAYAPMLLALALKMLRSVSDAEEIVQELFQDIWRNVFSAMEGTVHPWMVTSTRDRALSRLRARGQRRQPQAFDPQSAWVIPGLIPASADGMAREEIVAALKTTSREEQQVLALAYYEGFTETEIADVLSRPVATVRTQLNTSIMALHHATPWHGTTAPSHEGFTPESYASRALMVLDGDDARRFDAHLALPCEACLSYLRGVKQTVALLPIVLAPVPPSPDIKERILFSIRLSRVAEADLGIRDMRPDPLPSAAPPDLPESPSKGKRIPWLMIGGMFLVLFILVGLAAYVDTLIDKVGGQYEFIQGQAHELSALKTELSGTREILSVLDSPMLEIVRLSGLSPSPESHGNLFWDAESKMAVLEVTELPYASDGTEYQLWIILKDKSILRSTLAAVAGPDSAKMYLTAVRLPAEFQDHVDVVAVVRVRKDAGAEAPGEMYLQGSAGPGGADQRTK